MGMFKKSGGEPDPDWEYGGQYYDPSAKEEEKEDFKFKLFSGLGNNNLLGNVT